MNKRRKAASCTVFEGKIVVSGGFSLNTVESYDFYANKWTYLPSMIEYRSFHASVSMGNKLFVIGGYEISSCEVFNIVSRKFCSIKTVKAFFNKMNFQAVCIRNEIVVFCDFYLKCPTQVFTYNVETNEWKLIDCGLLKDIYQVSCIRYHQ